MDKALFLCWLPKFYSHTIDLCDTCFWNYETWRLKAHASIGCIWFPSIICTLKSRFLFIFSDPESVKSFCWFLKVSERCSLPVASWSRKFLPVELYCLLMIISQSPSNNNLHSDMLFFHCAGQHDSLSSSKYSILPNLLHRQAIRMICYIYKTF